MTTDKRLDEFIKKWRKENNTDNAIYSSYHYDAMQAYADKNRLNLLLEIKSIFDIQSDSSVFCNGYNRLKELIIQEQLKDK